MLMKNKMEKDYILKLYAKAYNTIQEIAWTFDNEEISNECVKLMSDVLQRLNDEIMESDNWTQQEKDDFIFFTDHLPNRIYFNC